MSGSARDDRSRLRYKGSDLAIQFEVLEERVLTLEQEIEDIKRKAQGFSE
jgi:predicted  nucleic acid-binding Zn-ribbon protein